MAVGDAALAFDLLSPQGMFFALYSGIKAAEAIAFALHNPDSPHDAAIRYQHSIEDVFAANQRARSLFYNSELRFSDNAYWQAQCEGLEKQGLAINNTINNANKTVHSA